MTALRVALFGATGFLGKETHAQLHAAGHAVTTIGRKNADHLADVANAKQLDAIEGEFDVVVNLAARVPSKPDTLAEHQAMFEANTIGAGNVAQWAFTRGAKRLVHGSTLAVVQRPWPVPLTEKDELLPTGPVAGYGLSKRAGEALCAAIAASKQRSFISLRYSALYGPGMVWTGVLPAFIDAARSGKRLSVMNNVHADFLHVDDAAKATVAACTSSIEGVVNVAAGAEIPIVELAKLALELAGRSPEEVDVKEGAPTRAVIEVTRLRVELGVPPGIPLAEGLRRLMGAVR